MNITAVNALALVNKPVVKRLGPVLAILALLVFAFVASSRGTYPFNGKLVACVGYGYGYGYTTGPPSVTSVVPASGGIAGGTSVAITGQGFCNFTTALNFGTTAAASYVINSDTSISAVSPAHAAGTVDVTVVNAAGTSATGAADQFTYTAYSGFFNWFDRASPGMLNDNIHIFNPGGSSATVTVTLPGAPTQSTTVGAGAEAYVTFPAGTIGGPVTVNSTQVVKVSQRVQYFQSFNEVWAETASQASLVQYFNWFDKASTGMVGDNIHIYNPGTLPASVTVSLPGATNQLATVAPGTEQYVTFPTGKIGGQVTVSSDHAVLASQRVQYYSSFNEVWAESASSAQTTQYFNWYDKASTGMLNDNIHLFNPGVSSAFVTVYLPDGTAHVTMVGAGAESYVSLPNGSIGGQVTVTSSQAVLASQRVQYYQSFNEVWAEAASQALSVGNFNWFDKASPGMFNVNIHMFNPGGSSASVMITLPNATTISTTVAAGTEVYVTFPVGTINGPVTVTSTGPALLTSLRVQYFQSFNEVWAT